MPEKSKARPLSASRQRRLSNRRASYSGDVRPPEEVFETEVFVEGLDLRSAAEKLDSLKSQLKVLEHDSTPEEHLNALVLIQLYSSLENGEKSIENAEACLALSKFYLDRQNLLPQAKVHILKAHQILEQLNIQPTDEHLTNNLLGFEVYLVLVKCSFNAKRYTLQRDAKVKTKHILAIDTTHIDHDLYVITEYLEKLKSFMSSDDYYHKHMDFLLLKFDIITDNLKEFNSTLSSLITDITENIDQHALTDKVSKKIDIYLQAGSYFISFEKSIAMGLDHYKSAVELAEKAEEEESCDLHRCQLAKAVFQWGVARVRVNRLGDSTERKFQRAIELYRKVNNENDRTMLKVMDALATYYMKTERFQDALNVLCDSLPDKRQLFGDYSEDVIETESRIGAIYLRECEYLPAAEHLKECLALQEFVYGPKDSRTCQTRDTLEILKKDPTVSRTFFSRTQDGIRQDRPAFRLSSKVSHDKEDHQLLVAVTKKPPMSSRN